MIGWRLIASIGIASLLSGREPDGLAVSCMFMIAAGSAPMRAAAGQEVTIATTTLNDYFNYEIAVTMIGGHNYTDSSVYQHEVTSAASEAADERCQYTD
eukprot:5157485-Amphidinium_carterae.1